MIFITGITGTIGRAMVDYLKDYYPIMGVDHNEQAVARFRKDYPKIKVAVSDFWSVDFNKVKPDTVIHLAAMKHVDICEYNANECVLNNVIKTQKLLREARQHNIDFIFMSTDKAVEPISVYGYTKALGEKMTLEYGGTVVRSGNVSQSNGSVLEIWNQAIKENKPMKVTHKEAVRYFISPQNLVKQVWQKYLAGEKLIIPIMDRKVKIMDLLTEVLEEYGYTLENYPAGIEYIGLRTGEKVMEKLEWAND